MRNLQSRITINPDQCGGRPCIRGMRIRVVDVLDLLAQGLTAEQLLEEIPDLKRDDIYAVLQFAARRLDTSYETHNGTTCSHGANPLALNRSS